MQAAAADKLKDPDGARVSAILSRKPYPRRVIHAAYRMAWSTEYGFRKYGRNHKNDTAEPSGIPG